MKRPVEEIQQRLKAPGSKQPPRESTAGESKCPTHLLHPIIPSSRSTQAYDNRLLWHESAPNLRSRVDKKDSPKSYALRKLRTIRRINSGCTSFARSGPECGRPLNPGSSVGKSLPGVPRSFCNVRSVGGTLRCRIRSDNFFDMLPIGFGCPNCPWRPLRSPARAAQVLTSGLFFVV